MSLADWSHWSIVALSFSSAINHVRMMRHKVFWVHVMRLFSITRSGKRNIRLSTMISILRLGSLVIGNLAHVAWFNIGVCPYSFTRLPHWFRILVWVEQIDVLIVLRYVTADNRSSLLFPWEIIVDHNVSSSLQFLVLVCWPIVRQLIIPVEVWNPRWSYVAIRHFTAWWQICIQFTLAFGIRNLNIWERYILLLNRSLHLLCNRWLLQFVLALLLLVLL